MTKGAKVNNHWNTTKMLNIGTEKVNKSIKVDLNILLGVNPVNNTKPELKMVPYAAWTARQKLHSGIYAQLRRLLGTPFGIGGGGGD